MLPLGPRELMGKKVRRPDGELVGVIKGLHQTTCNGCFDEISIDGAGGTQFVPMAALLPDGECYILMDDVLVASPARSRPGQVPVALPVAASRPDGSPAPPGHSVPSAPDVLTVQELTLTAIPPLTPEAAASEGTLRAIHISPMPSVSLKTRPNNGRGRGMASGRTTPLAPDRGLRGIVAGLEPPKPHPKASKKKSGKRAGKERSKKVSIHGARSFFNISTILQRFI